MEAPDASLLTGTLSNYPELMAIAIAILGIVVARLARYGTRRLIGSANRLLARTGSDNRTLISERVVHFVAAAVFWVLIATTLLLVLRTLGTGRVMGWIDAPLAHLPRIFVGLVIIGVGHVLGIAARNLVLRLQPDPDQAEVAPRLVQGAIFTLGVITGIQQMGLDISFVAELIILVIGVSLAGLSLAFALGARDHVANLVARSAMQRFTPGDRIRIDDIEGTIVEIHRTGADLSTSEGVVTVPAARFNTSTVLRFELGVDMLEDDA